ncbi:hypothetical protein I203_107988 [Kwoniella mangroviensis CBS 8507]|uniref:hypothetical protein n=1 Tax=Kwoniella mangroviensis CBS 8507 TaxID=1296122 RepID=UPI00080CF411|nr:uncharacterized protein I203_04882 [Kwoniella mangroviensis CBS 8507]OCF65862.1 hypothetical protein I203_04882 [Kwoniella mangroviensis CBS 8507]
MSHLSTLAAEHSPNQNQDEASLSASLSPQLPSEIWTKVISFVKRPKPAASESSSRVRRTFEVRQYGQGDLAVCMRVCKKFHHLTAPILYEEVIVDDLLQFFYGVNERDDSDITNALTKSAETLSKIEILKYTKAFHVVHGQHRAARYYGPVPPAPVNLPLPMISDCNSTQVILAKVHIPWCNNPNTPMLFPSLEAVTTGGYGSRPLAYLPPTLGGVPSSIRPKCKPRLEVYTVHITQRMVESNSDIRLMRGRQNRWVVSQEYASRNAATNYEMVIWLSDQIEKTTHRLSTRKKWAKHTSIEIYNVLNQHTAKAFVKYHHGIQDSSYDFPRGLEVFLNGHSDIGSIKLMKEPAEVCPACGA